MSGSIVLNNSYFDVLLRPIVSEKATMVASREGKQYLFLVSKDATKIKIKAAVEAIFDVKVESVNSCNRPGKIKRRGNIFGRRASQHRAYVCLKKGEEINLDVSLGGN